MLCPGYLDHMNITHINERFLQVSIELIFNNLLICKKETGKVPICPPNFPTRKKLPDKHLSCFDDKESGTMFLLTQG